MWLILMTFAFTASFLWAPPVATQFSVVWAPPVATLVISFYTIALWHRQWRHFYMSTYIHLSFDFNATFLFCHRIMYRHMYMHTHLLESGTASGDPCHFILFHRIISFWARPVRPLSFHLLALPVATLSHTYIHTHFIWFHRIISIWAPPVATQFSVLS